MAVVHDAASTSKVTSATSLTWSHTCTGSDRVLVVGALINLNIAVTNVTYAGSGITSIQQVIGGGGFCRSEQWGKIAPATGANNIVITVASATGIVGGGESVTGADQGSGWQNGATASGVSTTPSVSVTSATGNLVVDAMVNGVNTSDLPTATVGAGQTQRWNDQLTNKIRGAGSTEPGAGSVTMSWSLSSSDTWGICGVDIIAAAGGAAGQPTMRRFGGTPYMSGLYGSWS